ncbi:GRF1-interacting factor 3 [Orobanche hederae]
MKCYLDENKKLILAILDNQHLGKLAECAQYQAQLQKNLMYLAAIADAQPQTPAMPAQMSPQPAAMPTQPQGGFYMQHPHAAAMAQQQQPGIFPSSFNSPHHHPPLVRHNNGNTTNLGGATSDAVGDETTN